MAARHRGVALSGLAYVAFFLASLVLPSIVGQGTGAGLVTPYSTDADVARYLAAAPRGAAPVAAFCQAVSALALLVFTAGAADFAHRSALHAAHAGLARASGTVASAFLLFSASSQWVLALPSTSADLPVYRAVMDLAFITGAAAQVATTGMLVGAVAAAGRGARSLPGWLAWTGVAVAAVSLLSMVSILAPAATPALPVGRYLGMAWFLCLAAVLLRRPRTATVR
ncbi:hypothetical protein [Sinomonas atrocyanea]